MNPVANQLHHYLPLFVAAVLLLMLPFFAMVPRAAAMDEHSMHTQQGDATLDCATACARAMNTPPPMTVIKEDETRAPDPEPEEIIPCYSSQSRAFRERRHNRRGDVLLALGTHPTLYNGVID